MVTVISTDGVHQVRALPRKVPLSTITLLIIFKVIRLQSKNASLIVKILDDMHMLQLKMALVVCVGTCPLKKKNTQNVEYHVPMLLTNIVVEPKVKPVGLCLEMSLKVSITKSHFGL